MSRLYDALRRVESQKRRDPQEFPTNPIHPVQVLNDVVEVKSEIEAARSAKIDVSPSSRLTALSDPRSLGAEKFRALATRLEHLRSQRELKSLQIVSSVVGEGKSFVAANLAITLAKYSKLRVLLVDGDLHRPTLADTFCLSRMKGLGDWWATPGQEIAPFLCKFNELPLWFLAAGTSCDQPYELLQSERLGSAMSWLAAQYDWIVVDSTPMSPIVDANLWSRLVDGTILVVREGVATKEALRKGLESLDNLKLAGIVFNEASEFNQVDYSYPYNGTK